MALDIAKLMEMRAQKGWPEERISRKQAADRQIQMFEEIENGSSCRCPACMGLALRPFRQYDHAGAVSQSDEN